MMVRIIVLSGDMKVSEPPIDISSKQSAPHPLTPNTPCISPPAFHRSFHEPILAATHSMKKRWKSGNASACKQDFFAELHPLKNGSSFGSRQSKSTTSPSHNPLCERSTASWGLPVKPLLRKFLFQQILVCRLGS